MLPVNVTRSAVLLLSALHLAAGGVDPTVVEAAKDQDRATLRALIAADADVNLPQADGATALHWATYRDDAVMVELLLSAGADANAVNDLGVAPLLLACQNGNGDLVAMLLQAGADGEARPESGETPLMAAARVGGIEAVRALLSHGAEVNAQGTDREQTALMWALAEKHVDIARLLIDEGAHLHVGSKSGFTPLLFAARAGDLEAVQVLLAAGADVNEEAKDGSRALLVATIRGHADVAMHLLDAGADPNASGTGYTALHWASGSWETEMTGPNGIVVPEGHEWSSMAGLRSQKVALAKALLDHGADPNALLEKQPPRVGYNVFTRRPSDSTPYYLAAMAGDAEIMALLVERGADPLLAGSNGMTPLMTASGLRWALAESTVPHERALAAVQMAVGHGADVNATEVNGESALHGAARIKVDAIVQFLVDSGAKVNVRNDRGQTPLFIAERYFHPGSKPLVSRTSTGDLLRKLAVREAAMETIGNWDSLSDEERRGIETLFLQELGADPSALGEGITDEMNKNPVLPRRRPQEYK